MYNHYKDFDSLLLSLSGNMESAVRSVMNAINQWERKTCLRFVPRTNEKAYLEFFKDQG